MQKIFVFILLINSCFAQNYYLKNIGEGSKNSFKIDKISVNPMSNPSNIFTNINLPDTLSIDINICNSSTDTVFTKSYNNLLPGLYQFSWSYENIIDKLKSGHYMLKVSAYSRKSSGYKYHCELPFLLINNN